jgi:hypothetical protein
MNYQNPINKINYFEENKIWWGLHTSAVCFLSLPWQEGALSTILTIQSANPVNVSVPVNSTSCPQNCFNLAYFSHLISYIQVSVECLPLPFEQLHSRESGVLTSPIWSAASKLIVRVDLSAEHLSSCLNSWYFYLIWRLALLINYFDLFLFLINSSLITQLNPYSTYRWVHLQHCVLFQDLVLQYSQEHLFPYSGQLHLLALLYPKCIQLSWCRSQCSAPHHCRLFHHVGRWAEGLFHHVGMREVRLSEWDEWC